ncbi:MAG: FixH family protein [Ginsengibacter sp.]
MNWGYKILLVYAVFVSGILFLVFKSSSQKIDLVTTDYYGKELKYQQQIDETNRANVLSEPVKYEITGNRFIVFFPKDFSGKKITGDVLLYCPSDEDKDLKQSFSTRDAPVIVPLQTMQKGLYELHLSWQADGVSYYFEEKVLLKTM